MTTETILNPHRAIDIHLENVVVIDKSPAHLREYDFNRGDERRFDRDEAIALANKRAELSGIRQQVRLTAPPTWANDQGPLWLIQDI